MLNSNIRCIEICEAEYDTDVEAGWIVTLDVLKFWKDKSWQTSKGVE